MMKLNLTDVIYIRIDGINFSDFFISKSLQYNAFGQLKINGLLFWTLLLFCIFPELFCCFFFLLVFCPMFHFSMAISGFGPTVCLTPEVTVTAC